jgi:medium-chain acyl-[acyl-carrier-protein] hydrolase
MEALRVGPADVTPAGRARLDRIACWLQDVAYHDVIDAAAEGEFWIVRRTRIRVERFPGFAEDLELRTFASGASHALAERRTSIEGSAGARIEAVAVWVNVDPETQTPARLSPRFLDAYGPAPERRPRSRLRHPPPPDSASASAWMFREGDLDLAGHVNNARYWAVVDELLLAGEEPVDVEMEHRNAAPAGEAVVRVADRALWVTSPGGEVYASAKAF